MDIVKSAKRSAEARCRVRSRSSGASMSRVSRSSRCPASKSRVGKLRSCVPGLVALENEMHEMHEMQRNEMVKSEGFLAVSSDGRGWQHGQVGRDDTVYRVSIIERRMMISYPYDRSSVSCT